ncbi:MBL fold metallo-hydrolase [Pedobacter sp. JY14-1]|uniref:MBL fold metallo-hydrolase n=1 Tax=Pedobacter sp. JY14-1 TaxID=3034151 RepID=UPI0023E2702C|nr:MBL fold metallo-hydrolase [Pedobacter sp. JY14-1]
MILDDFIVLDNTGLYCRYGQFYLDPKFPVPRAVISHAHGDHAVGGNGEVYCTGPTQRFMEHRYKRFAAQRFHIYGYRHEFLLNGVKISFLPAGHMLGSAMVLMEYQGVRYLYTGDYKLQPDLTCEPVELVGANVLITETTFADPDFSHPDAVGEVLKLNDVRGNIMLGAYALGKSQRLISLISKYCTEKRILLHHSIVPFARIYEEMGITLGKYEVYDRKLMKQQKDHMIYMVPPMVFNSYFRAVNVVRVFATGWKYLQQGNPLQLLISDHADWDDILLTVDRVKPEQIWTNHGNGRYLQQHLEKKLVVKLLN